MLNFLTPSLCINQAPGRYFLCHVWCNSLILHFPKLHMKFCPFFCCTSFGRWTHWWVYTLTKIFNILRNSFLPFLLYSHFSPNFFTLLTDNCHLVFIYQCHITFFNYLLCSWHLLSQYYILSMVYEYIFVPITTEYSVMDYFTQFHISSFPSSILFPLQEICFLSGRS